MEKEDIERRKRNEEGGASLPFGYIRIQLLSCQSYVNPRCFFAALLIIDHLITIHYTLSPPPSHFFSPLWYTVAVERERERESIIRASEGNGEVKQGETERGKLFFLCRRMAEGRPFAYRSLPPPSPHPYRQIHRGRPS